MNPQRELQPPTVAVALLATSLAEGASLPRQQRRRATKCTPIGRGGAALPLQPKRRLINWDYLLMWHAILTYNTSTAGS